MNNIRDILNCKKKLTLMLLMSRKTGERGWAKKVAKESIAPYWQDIDLEYKMLKETDIG